jgi:membrane protein DedA with SNARE-associated domain
MLEILTNSSINPLILESVFFLIYGFTTPIPEELALIMIGLTFKSVPFYQLLGIAILSITVADLIYYSIGRFFLSNLLKIKFIENILRPDKINDSQIYFKRKGPKILFTCRFVLGLRSAAILGAGLLQFPILKFLKYDAAALCIGTSAWLFVGRLLIQTASIGIIGHILSICGPILVVVIAVLIFKSVKADHKKIIGENS